MPLLDLSFSTLGTGALTAALKEVRFAVCWSAQARMSYRVRTIADGGSAGLTQN